MQELTVDQLENMDELHFQEALKGLTEKEQQMLEEVFAKWVTCSDWEGHGYYGKCDHQRLLENIRKEHYLKLTRFSSILKHFISHVDKSMPKMLAAIQSVINNNSNSFKLEGEPVKEQPAVFATAILKEDLENYLEAQDFLMDEIRDFYATEPGQYNDKERRAFIKLTNEIVWLTWDEYKAEDPYLFLPELNTHNIRHSMALSERYKDRQMVLFYFKFDGGSGSSTELHRPTWCDANFFDKFRTTDPSKEKRWGLTFPTNEIPVKTSYSSRRPEGVILSENLTCKHVFKRTKILTQ